ncbi:hypothetical protein WN51_04181 [Melipona quadrifasciata]|uniref:Uncharacterized protein n=1 Tax=Melipona quadrifasciata TaxID=166423 RepID=A0A0N1ITB3_9HYME|nr:hypothetical protein WN51_04181 [Melipona quadrifasciata]
MKVYRKGCGSEGWVAGGVRKVGPEPMERLPAGTAASRCWKKFQCYKKLGDFTTLRIYELLNDEGHVLSLKCVKQSPHQVIVIRPEQQLRASYILGLGRVSTQASGPDTYQMVACKARKNPATSRGIRGTVPGEIAAPL